MALPTHVRVNYTGWIEFAGKKIPYPANDLTQGLYTTVDQARNANNVMVGQKVGRDQYKLDNLYWRILNDEDWNYILSIADDFKFKVKFYAMGKGWITITMYAGDRTAKPLTFNSDGSVAVWQECKMNVIDVGIVSEV